MREHPFIYHSISTLCITAHRSPSRCGAYLCALALHGPLPGLLDKIPVPHTHTPDKAVPGTSHPAHMTRHPPRCTRTPCPLIMPQAKTDTPSVRVGPCCCTPLSRVLYCRGASPLPSLPLRGFSSLFCGLYFSHCRRWSANVPSLVRRVGAVDLFLN